MASDRGTKAGEPGAPPQPIATAGRHWLAFGIPRLDTGDRQAPYGMPIADGAKRPAVD